MIYIGGASLSFGALSRPGNSPSHVAYVYPAGAQRGKTIEITLGGQGLKRIKHIYISGEGVKAEYVRTIHRFPKTYGDYLRFLLKEKRQKGKGRLKRGVKKDSSKTKIEAKKATKTSKKTKKKKLVDEMMPPPDHPKFRGLDKLSVSELSALLKRYYKENKQKNRQLDDRVLIKLSVADDAPLGRREIRLQTSAGLTNPIWFYVGEKPEIYEKEPNEKSSNNPLLEAPFVANGQIMPGDRDRFQFRAKSGQKLLIRGMARAIIPYLADAVPGWFQATLTLYDSDGRELSFVDDYQYHPDPILFFKIPHDGIYTIEIRDSIFRGREDFVYRISVGEDPFITSIFPMGGKEGTRVKVQLQGWNLPKHELTVMPNNTKGSTMKLGVESSNLVPFAVDHLPECIEMEEGHDTPKKSQFVELPVIVNGRISHPREVDCYRFKGKGGEKVVLDVHARRLHSPLDSRIQIKGFSRLFQIFQAASACFTSISNPFFTFAPRNFPSFINFVISGL